MSLDLDRIASLFLVYGLNFVGAIVVAVATWWVADLTQRTTRQALLASSSRIDPTVVGFLSSLARYAILIVAFLIILQLIGIQATSLVAVVGAASLAVGLALQGTLSNMAAGVMLLLFRPFKVGDSIEVAGRSGTVKDLNLFMTELASGDNVQVLIPNNQVWGSTIVNLSAYPTRRLSVTCQLPLGTSLEQIMPQIGDFLRQDTRVLDAPPPTVTVASFKEKTVEVSVQAWTHATEVTALQVDLMSHVQAQIGSAAPELIPGAKRERRGQD
jgi:small conductance mechanosensitive channel